MDTMNCTNIQRLKEIERKIKRKMQRLKEMQKEIDRKRSQSGVSDCVCLRERERERRTSEMPETGQEGV